MQAIIASPADLGRLVRQTRQTHHVTQRDLAARAVLAALGIHLTATVHDD